MKISHPYKILLGPLHPIAGIASKELTFRRCLVIMCNSLKNQLHENYAFTWTFSFDCLYFVDDVPPFLQVLCSTSSLSVLLFQVLSIRQPEKCFLGLKSSNSKLWLLLQNARITLQLSMSNVANI